MARPGRYVEAMAASNPPQVSKGEMMLPKGVGLAVDLNPDFLKKNWPRAKPIGIEQQARSGANPLDAPGEYSSRMLCTAL